MTTTIWREAPLNDGAPRLSDHEMETIRVAIGPTINDVWAVFGEDHDDSRLFVPTGKAVARKINAFGWTVYELVDV